MDEQITDIMAEPQTEEVKQDGAAPVSVVVDVHQDANPEIPETKKEDITEWQTLQTQLETLTFQMMELSQKMDGVLMLQAVTAEAEIQEAEAEAETEQAEAMEQPELLEPERNAEPEQKSKPKKQWVW
jgi:hypothetical protein